MKNTRYTLTLAALAVALNASVALADPESDVGFRGWGPRVGLSMRPDQVHFGAHLDYGHLRGTFVSSPTSSSASGTMWTSSPSTQRRPIASARRRYLESLSRWRAWRQHQTLRQQGTRPLGDRPWRQCARRDRAGACRRRPLLHRGQVQPERHPRREGHCRLDILSLAEERSGTPSNDACPARGPAPRQEV